MRSGVSGAGSNMVAFFVIFFPSNLSQYVNRIDALWAGLTLACATDRLVHAETLQD